MSHQTKELAVVGGLLAVLALGLPFLPMHAPKGLLAAGSLLSASGLIGWFMLPAYKDSHTLPRLKVTSRTMAITMVACGALFIAATLRRLLS